MQRVFIGSEAIAAGAVTKYQLRAHFQRVFPDVYAHGSGPLSVRERTTAAVLWSRRLGVVTDLAASALHGARWVSDQAPIELNYSNNKAPKGIVSRDETLLDDEVQTLRGLTVTTLQRTAFDLARRGTVGEAVARLDALANAAQFRVDDVLDLLSPHPNLSGVRRVPEVLDLVDGGAQSPKETWLRLLFIDAGFPRPRTQIPVLGRDGRPRYYLDMGWEDVMIAAEYDGEHHRVDRYTYTNDIERSEYIHEVGWRMIRVVATNRRADIIERIRRAWASRQNSAR
ncbi:MAG: hypothetical protein ABWY93_06330 [Mycobacterium sp.]